MQAILTLPLINTTYISLDNDDTLIGWCLRGRGASGGGTHGRSAGEGTGAAIGAALLLLLGLHGGGDALVGFTELSSDRSRSLPHIAHDGTASTVADVDGTGDGEAHGGEETDASQDAKQDGTRGHQDKALNQAEADEGDGQEDGRGDQSKDGIDGDRHGSQDQEGEEEGSQRRILLDISAQGVSRVLDAALEPFADALEGVGHAAADLLHCLLALLANLLAGAAIGSRLTIGGGLASVRLHDDGFFLRIVDGGDYN